MCVFIIVVFWRKPEKNKHDNWCDNEESLRGKNKKVYTSHRGGDLQNLPPETRKDLDDMTNWNRKQKRGSTSWESSSLYVLIGYNSDELLLFHKYLCVCITLIHTPTSFEIFTSSKSLYLRINNGIRSIFAFNNCSFWASQNNYLIATKEENDDGNEITKNSETRISKLKHSSFILFDIVLRTERRRNQRKSK